MKWIFWVWLIICGCGHKEDFEVLCPTDLAWKVGGTAGTMCARLVYNLQIAKFLMKSSFQAPDGTTLNAVRDDDNWNALFNGNGGVTIWVAQVDNLQPEFSNFPYGEYNSWTGEVKLTDSQRALVHELLHRIDVTDCRAGTQWHAGWKTNGYQQLIDAYQTFSWWDNHGIKPPAP